MGMRELAEQAAATVIAITAVGGAVLWLFREKITAHYDRRLVKALGGDPDEDSPREILARSVDRRAAERFGATLGGWDAWRVAMDEEQAQLGSRMAEQERANERIAAAFESAARAVGDGVQRLTVQVERIAESHEETRETVAHIRGWVDGQKGTALDPRR